MAISNGLGSLSDFYSSLTCRLLFWFLVCLVCFFFRYSLHNGSCGAAQIERDPFSLAVKSGKRLFTGSSAVSVARDGL